MIRLFRQSSFLITGRIKGDLKLELGVFFHPRLGNKKKKKKRKKEGKEREENVNAEAGVDACHLRIARAAGFLESLSSS